MAHGQSDYTEGYASVPGGKVWYKILGSGDSIPLLTLHGGPGAGHDYFEPLEELAADRPVVFFDQLGCGKSDRPDDVSLWNIGRFVKEVTALRHELGLERVHLLGQSWGGWLAIEYMLGNPTGVDGLVLESTSASIRQVANETARLKSQLSPAVLETLERYEAAGEFHHPEYEEAMMEFYTRHVCRLEPWPDCVMRALDNLADSAVVYETIQGPNEFTFTGNLKDWDRTDRLGEIRVPTLITVGRHDELTPDCARVLHQGISDSKLRIFENSSHFAHLEEKTLFLQTVRDFLAGADAA